MSRRYAKGDRVRVLVAGESTPPELATVRRTNAAGRPTEVLDTRNQTILREGEFDVLDRCSLGLSDWLVELEDELRELRVRVDGAAEEARERGEGTDEAILAEISELLDRAKTVAAEATDPS